MLPRFRSWGALAAAVCLNCVKHEEPEAPPAPYTDTGGTYEVQPGLQILLTGTGNGRVTASCDNPAYRSSLAAISCSRDGGECWADVADAGTTTVTLTAVPDPSSRLASWTGPCVAIAGQPETATLSMDGQTDAFCTARFDLSGCNNPDVIFSSFDTDADWEWQDLGAGVTASSSPTGGNPGGFRLGGLDRLPGLGVYFALYALQHDTYDPATRGAVTGFLYEEDRILVTEPQPGEGIRSGLYLRDANHGFSGFIEPQDTWFAGTLWTKGSRRVELTEIPMSITAPFRVGYIREIFVREGKGTLEHGIDNVRISICH